MSTTRMPGTDTRCVEQWVDGPTRERAPVLVVEGCDVLPARGLVGVEGLGVVLGHDLKCGRTLSPKSLIWSCRRSPQSSSITCVQPASRYSSIAAMQSSGVPAIGLQRSSSAVRHLGLGGEPSSPLHRFRDRRELVHLDLRELEQRVRRALDVLKLVREVHPRDLAGSVAARVAIRLVDRGHDRAADIDVRGDVLTRVADEGRRGNRRRQAAVRDLARERLHLRRGRRDINGRDVARRVRLVEEPRNGCAPRLALVLERPAAEDPAHDLDRVAHRAERLPGLRADVVEEDLRGAEAEQEPTRPGCLLDHPRVHRDLHRMARERRDDPPADRQPLRLPRHER